MLFPSDLSQVVAAPISISSGPGLFDGVWVRAALALACAALAGSLAGAAERKPRAGMLPDDFPVQGACIGAAFPAKNTAMKGLAIRVGNDAAMLFDTDLLRMAAGWTGGYIDTHGVAFDGAHGAHPKIVGAQQFGTGPAPGWADARGGFADPRAEPFGPLPSEWCRWDGLYVSGMNVVLAYTVHGTKILEQPGSETARAGVAFTRAFKMESTKARLTLLICDVEGAAGIIDGTVAYLTATVSGRSVVTNNGVVTTNLTTRREVTAAGLVGAPAAARLEILNNSRLVLTLPAGSPAALFKVVLWRGRAEDQAGFAAFLEGKLEMADCAKGGPSRWPEAVKTRGVLNTSSTPDGAYATDAITAPVENPWKRRVRFGGFDFFADGRRAAFCTHDGDIWIVSGLDETLENLEWRRFASGMYETLGLAIVDDRIYTSGRDQITRYHDFNQDGEADYYENFNNEIMSTEGFHEFVFDLQTDHAGNFYFAKANPVNAGGGGFGDQKAAAGNGTVCSHSGCLFKLGRDGRKLEILARGFRAPNGIGVSPAGQATTSDNEGTWVPTTPLHWIRPGQFCGVINQLISTDTSGQWVPPLCWLSKEYDNSGGGQIWVTSGKWGPFQGELLHESYGRSSLFLVLKEELAGGRMQGGVVRFPLKFTSSVMRARFHPQDGQLYIAGLSEWQSNAAKVTGFDRVRYTGKPVYSVKSLKVVKGGVQLGFTQPLATDGAGDLQNYSGKRWNYERAEHYGSPEFSVAEPKKKGRDELNITGAKLSDDGRTVTLEIADLKPVMQQSIKFNLKAADGTPIAQEIQHTIHSLP